MSLIGKRITMTHMSDPHPIKPGEQGVITHVDCLGQIHVKWDSGRTLAVIPNEDSYIITD